MLSIQVYVVSSSYILYSMIVRRKHSGKIVHMRLFNKNMRTNLCLFVLILYVRVNIYQPCRDGSSLVEPILGCGQNFLLEYNI